MVILLLKNPTVSIISFDWAKTGIEINHEITIDMIKYQFGRTINTRLSHVQG